MKKEYEDKEFKNLKLKNETLEKLSFINCSFVNCTFEDCKLIRTSFSDSSFYKCVISNIKTPGNSHIEDTEITECQLTGIYWNELLPDFKFADPISRLENCYLKYNTFSDMIFKKFSFSGNTFSNSMFAKCQLTECLFNQCKLEETEFLESNLQKADFRNATEYKIDIMTCNLKGARFSFPEAINLLNVLKVKID